jgi:hypothetical protein
MGNKFDWHIEPDGSGADVRPDTGHSYDLFNLNVSKVLRYGEREYGINLVWGDLGSADESIGFARASSGSGPIQFRERIAIRVRGGRYLRYGEREYGINLVWSDQPIFEWHIEGDGGATGNVIRGIPIALFNETHSDYLFYDPRRYGINLKWLKDEGRFNDSPWYEDVGDFFSDVWSAGGNVFKDLFNRALGLPDSILTFFGIMLPKEMRFQVRILRAEDGRAVMADENLPAADREADLDQIKKAIAHMREVFDSQVNTDAIAIDDEDIITLDVVAPTAALDVGCGSDAWQDDFGEAGEFFRRHLAKRGTSWALGYGAPITAFVVRGISGKRGCSLGPVTDYITIDPSGFEDDPEGGMDDVEDGKPPSTLAHEMGHACGLWHPLEVPEKPLGNLMLASRRGRGKILELHQRSIFRGSRHVTFF